MPVLSVSLKIFLGTRKKWTQKPYKTSTCFGTRNGKMYSLEKNVVMLQIYYDNFHNFLSCVLYMFSRNRNPVIFGRFIHGTINTYTLIVILVMSSKTSRMEINYEFFPSLISIDSYVKICCGLSPDVSLKHIVHLNPLHAGLHLLVRCQWFQKRIRTANCVNWKHVPNVPLSFYLLLWPV